MPTFKAIPVGLAALAVGLMLSACGSGGNEGSKGGGGAAQGSFKGANIAVAQGQKKGGTLNVVSAEGWEHVDPGQSYFQIDYIVVGATQRQLYAFRPDGKTPTPDIADGPPTISADGKTVTIKLKPNVKFSKPVDRAVTSDDVKYGFERMFNPNVPNAYATSYFPIVGSDKSKGGPLSGIDTPDKTTVVFHLTKDFGATFYQALTLPGSAPVPRDYAAPLDKKNPTKYDADPTAQAFTGPYMIQSYNAGRSMTLVRNPNWDPKTDFRPAYADKIVWKAGGDPNVLARQTLRSPDLLMADSPPSPVLKTAYQTKRSQLSVSPLGNYYATLNTKIKPFDNANLRRAVVAAANRQGYLLARGGKLVGQVATHYLDPTSSAFEAAGGVEGPGYDFLANPAGDLEVAKKYMKLAGYPSGRYTGKETVLIVGANADPGPKEMQVVQEGLRKLGFRTRLKPVPQQTMYSKFCGVVKAAIHVCPTAGWIPDFTDAYAYLYVPFSGKSIIPVNNPNWARFDDPRIDAAMDKAATITDSAARIKAWGEVDKMITKAAPAIPEIWSSNAVLKGTKVKGVLDVWNDDWNLAFSSPR